MCKPWNKWKNYLMTNSTQPQASWSLRTDNVNCRDTILMPVNLWHHPAASPSARELHTSPSHILQIILPHLPFKNAFQKPFDEHEAFQGMSHLFFFHGPAIINISLLQTQKTHLRWHKPTVSIQLSSVNVFALPCDFLNTILFSLTYFILKYSI